MFPELHVISRLDFCALVSPSVSGIFTMGLSYFSSLLHPIRASEVHLSLFIHLFYPQLIVSGVCHDPCFAVPLSSVSPSIFSQTLLPLLLTLSYHCFPSSPSKALLISTIIVANQKAGGSEILSALYPVFFPSILVSETCNF